MLCLAVLPTFGVTVTTSESYILPIDTEEITIGVKAE